MVHVTEMRAIKVIDIDAMGMLKSCYGDAKTNNFS